MTKNNSTPTGKSQGKDETPPVKDLPPANPLGEPVEPVEAYHNTSEPEKLAIAAGVELAGAPDGLISGETVVEHPLSPTDSNPNPHGQRNIDEATEMVSDPDTKVSHRQVIDGDTEIEGDDDRGVHLGDGRVLAKGERAKVSKDIAGLLVKSKQAKRV